MNNFKLFIFLAVMIISANSYGQGSSNTAYSIPLNDSTQIISVSDSVVWFKFVAPDTGIVVSLTYPQGVTPPTTNIALYKYVSNGLGLIQQMNETNSMSYNNKTTTDTSYIKITFVTVYIDTIYINIGKEESHNAEIGARKTGTTYFFTQEDNIPNGQEYDLLTLCIDNVDIECIPTFNNIMYYPGNEPYKVRFFCDGIPISLKIPLVPTGSNFYPYITTLLPLGKHIVSFEIYYPDCFPFNGDLYYTVASPGNGQFTITVLDNITAVSNIFDQMPTTTCLGTPFIFPKPNNSSTEYVLNSGSSNLLISSNPQNWIIQSFCPGQYNLTVTASNICGGTSTTVYPLLITTGPDFQFEKTLDCFTYDFTESSCLHNSELGQYLLLNYCTLQWNFGDGTISTQQNPSHLYTAAGTYNVSLTINYNGQSGCSLSETVTKVVTIALPPVPIVTGNKSKCTLDNNIYSLVNFNPNFTYTWSLTNNSGIITNISNGEISINWNPFDPDLPSLCPGETINVTVVDENGCSSLATFNVYECCTDFGGSGAIVYNTTTTFNGTQVLNNSSSFYVFNEDVIIDGNITFESTNVKMSPNTKFIINPNAKLIINNTTIEHNDSCCIAMWDGIYVSDPTAEVVITGNSTIKDAINGIVSDNGGKFTLNDANMTNNYYNIRVKNTHLYGIIPPPGQPYPPFPGTVKNTEFIGSNPLTYSPLAGIRTLMGIECNNAMSFTIGDESSVTLRNTFTNMRFGIYAYNSDINVYNNQFINIINGTFLSSEYQKYYTEGAIYATHKTFSEERPDNYLNVGGDLNKRNYFENCNTGIYSFQYVNTLNDNNFLDCFNGISLVNISSGTEVKDNLIYGSLASVVTPGKGISFRNAHPNNNGIDCLIKDNHITNKRTGISILGVKSAELITRVTNNHIISFVTDFPNTPAVSNNERQSGIIVGNCDGIEVSFNTVYRNYPALGANMEFNTILGIWISDSRGANIFQNYLNQVGSGIYTNGSLTNTQFNCNTFDDNYFGMQFGFYSDITDQGIANDYNPYNLWNDFSPQTGHERIYDDRIINNFDYYYDPNAYQAYDPSIASSGMFSFIQNPNGGYICENNGTVGPLGPVDQIDNLQAREVALGKIVRDEKYYSFMEEEYQAKDREYAYEILREDPTIMNMGGPDDNVYLQFYNDGYNSDIETVLQMREEMYEQNLELAREKLTQIAGEDVININRIIVDNIYIDTWASGINDFSPEQEDALYAVANLPAYAGGDAVYTARVMLNIDPMDIGVDYAIAPKIASQITIGNPVRIFPNPASSQLTIQFNDIISNDVIIQIYGNMGNLVLSEIVKQNNYIKTFEIRQLNAGLYFYKLTMNGANISSGKLTILNK